MTDGPWSDFQTQSNAGPWTDFQKAAPQGGAFSDVVPEIKNAFNENLDAVKNIGGGDNPSTFGGFLDTGKALLGLPGMAMAPITGAARSLIGHPMADLTHKAGELINPQIAAQDNPQQMYEQAKGNVDTALMAAAPKGTSPVGFRSTPAPTPLSPELKTAAVNVWESPQIKGIQIPPQDVANLSASIENELTQKAFRPTGSSAQDTFTEVKRMSPGHGVQSVSVDDLRNARMALNDVAGQIDPATFKPTRDAAAARHAIGRIDDYLDNLAPSLKEANANYAAGMRADTLDYRAMKADRRAAKTGSGSNIENTMRQEADKIGDRGLNAAEQAARDQIVMGTNTRNALRKIGKYGFGDGLSIMYHAALAGPTLGMNLPFGVAATIGRKIGEKLTRAEIAALNEMIRARSPLAQSTPPMVAGPPSPMLGAAFPQFAVPQAFGLGMTPMQIPAYANQDQNRRGR